MNLTYIFPKHTTRLGGKFIKMGAWLTFESLWERNFSAVFKWAVAKITTVFHPWGCWGCGWGERINKASGRRRSYSFRGST